MSDESDDVMRVITGQIEAHFAMSVPSLRRAVAVTPHANPAAVEVVRWHGLLATAQSALERAEDALVAVLDTVPGDLSEDHDRIMRFANRVNEAVDLRDGRASVLAFLLDPGTPGKHGPAAWRSAVPAHRQGKPALPTTAPALPTVPSVPVRRGAAR
ncbi:hypothetical protein GCM10010232_49890 [Streptomyces amakusaensis]|uniref:Uncharacterized protein n=1 Tax=Streptomyces amakusaensis TaxID=67271 RepID=A0ABW0APY5_9ACTN